MLSQTQINKFKEIHQKSGGLEGCSDDQIRRVAMGVAGYYLALFKIYKENEKTPVDKLSDALKKDII